MRVVGVALLALAVVWPHRRLVQALLAALAGAALMAACWHPSFENRSGNWWAVGAAMLVSVALWWAVPRLRTGFSMPGSRWVLFVGSAFAVYCCVPETDQMWEVGLVIAAAVVAEVLRQRVLPTPVDAAVAGLILWSALFGATGRPSALVGGLFALMPLVAVPAVMAARPALAVGRLRWRWALAIVWIGAAIAVARTGGIARTAAPAWIAVVCVTAAALLASELLARLAGRAHSAG